MVKVSSTFTRPSVTTPWHYEVIDMSAVNALSVSPEWVNKHALKSTNDFIGAGSGALTMVSDVVWASQADFNAFAATAEFKAYEAARDAYNSANGITASPLTFTTV